MLGRVVEVESLEQAPCFLWWESLIERCRAVGAQVVEHHRNGRGCGIVDIHQGFHLLREVARSALRRHLDRQARAA